MRGYVNIPKSIYCKLCRECGARPIIAHAGLQGYEVRCPNDELHYRTVAGIIDIEDWNIHNTVLYENDYDLKMMGRN
ncbi:hypothetical protein A0256_21470 [Mucilaginibacter sp. PAMC 26640]|nr:hypothetical protein A0256_21470 [Mucilaginibacter sp. PAMC 26640]